jgi:hypothetical protein
MPLAIWNSKLRAAVVATFVLAAWTSEAHASCDPRDWRELTWEAFTEECGRPHLYMGKGREIYEKWQEQRRLDRELELAAKEARRKRIEFEEKLRTRAVWDGVLERERLKLEGLREHYRREEEKRMIEREKAADRLREELRLERERYLRKEGGINLSVKPEGEAKDLSAVRKKVLELPR